MKKTFKDYGVGLGYRPAFFKEFKNIPPLEVSWVEVISENYLPWGGAHQSPSLQNLLKIRESLPVALHGVSMNLGSIDKLDLGYLKKLKALALQIQPLWISDHLCWTGVEGVQLHDLLPLPYTQEAMNQVIDKIKKVQDFFGQRILIENLSSYIEFKNSEMKEWEFLSEIVQKSDCGILLDINNVYVSSINHKFNPKDYLKAIPHHKVGQIHLAGHRKKNGILIDTHDEPVCNEVWTLFHWWNEHYGSRSTMIERDDHFPEWKEIQKELLKIHAIRSLGKEENEQPQIHSKTIE